MEFPKAIKPTFFFGAKFCTQVENKNEKGIFC
jgi:hypothetical protein